MQKKIAYIIIGPFTVTCVSIIAGLVIDYTTGNAAEALSPTTTPTVAFTLSTVTNLALAVATTPTNVSPSSDYLGPVRDDLPSNFEK